MIEATFHGRARFLSVSGTAAINPWLARVWSISATAGPHTVNVPAPDRRMAGGPALYVFNIGASAFNLATPSDGTTSIPPGNVIIATVHLDANGVPHWYGNIRVTNTGAVALAYRKIVIAGGSAGAATSTAFDQIAGTWAAGGGIPNNKSEAAAIDLEGAGYVTGFHPLTGGVSDRCDEVAPVTHAWTNRQNCPFQTGRAQACGLPLLGKGKLFSGTGTPNTAEFSMPAWVSKKVVPYAKTRGSAQAVKDRAYLISGEPVPIINLAHDPIADSYWGIAGYPSAARHSMATFAIEHKLYSVGGYLDSPLTRYDKCDEYDPLTDSWVVKTALSLGIRYGGAGVGGNFRGYFCGGRDNADAHQAGAASYNLDAWTALAGMPAARAETANAGVSI